ncbi:PDDEXK nuclease domain-containing protein [Desulfococcaceae bacterium HSG8]|nr:PDDEXK nuclease domain-containing protein [Desulfococcaceae bacterium HSG8]
MKNRLPQPVETDFAAIIAEIKTARSRALQNVNRELVTLYWNIGKQISEKLKTSQWGRGVVGKLAIYIKKNAPEIKGFSRRGLYRMRQFYETYEGNEIVPSVMAQLSWTHHTSILAKTTGIEEKEFYMQLAIKEKYTVRELERQIDSGYFERYMLAQKKEKQPEPSALIQKQSDISKSFLDTYMLDFLDLPKGYSEQDLQQGIVANLKDFILEVGRDFSFIGQQYRIQVGDKDFYPDLLFYHRQLQSLVVFELKITEFRPEYIGQLDFYLEYMDREIKKDHENPSIGVLLCKSKNDEIVEFALSRSISPALVAKYETQLIDKNLLKQKLHEFYELEIQNKNADNAGEGGGR